MITCVHVAAVLFFSTALLLTVCTNCTNWFWIYLQFCFGNKWGGNAAFLLVRLAMLPNQKILPVLCYPIMHFPNIPSSVKIGFEQFTETSTVE